MLKAWRLDSQISTASLPKNNDKLVASSNQLPPSSSSPYLSQNPGYVADQPIAEPSKIDNKSRLLHMSSTGGQEPGQPVPSHRLPPPALEEKATGFTWLAPSTWNQHPLRHQPAIPSKGPKVAFTVVPHMGFQVASENHEELMTQAPFLQSTNNGDDVIFKTVTPDSQKRPVASIRIRRMEVAGRESIVVPHWEDYHFESISKNSPRNVKQTPNDVTKLQNEATTCNFQDEQPQKPLGYTVPGMVSGEDATNARQSSVHNSSCPAETRFSNRDHGRDLRLGKRKRHQTQRPAPEDVPTTEPQEMPSRRPDYASSVVRHNECHSLTKSRPLANHAELRAPSPGNSSTVSETNIAAKSIFEKLNQKYLKMCEDERVHREHLETINEELRRDCALQEERIQDQQYRLTELLQLAASWELEKKDLIRDVESAKAERVDQESKVTKLGRLLEEQQQKSEEQSEQIKIQEKTMISLQNDRRGLEAKKSKLREKADRIKEAINCAIKEQQELHQRNKIRMEEVMREVRQEAQDMKVTIGLALMKTDEVQKRVLNAARAVRQESAVAFAERDLNVEHLTKQLLEKNECLSREQDTVNRLLDNASNTDAQLQAVENILATRFTEFLELYEKDKRRLDEDLQQQVHLESKIDFLVKGLGENALHNVNQAKTLSDISQNLTEAVAPVLNEISDIIPHQLSRIEAQLDVLQTQHAAREDALGIELKECKQGNSVLATTVEEKFNEIERLETENYRLQRDLEAATTENASLQEKTRTTEKQLTGITEKLNESEHRLNDTVKERASEMEQVLGRLVVSDISSTNNCQRISDIVTELENARSDAVQATQKLQTDQSAWKEQLRAADQRSAELEAKISQKEGLIAELQVNLNTLRTQQEKEWSKDSERWTASKIQNDKDATIIKNLSAELEQKEQVVREAEDRANSLENELSDSRKRAAAFDQLVVKNGGDLANMRASLASRTAELQSSEERRQSAADTIATLKSKVNELEIAQQPLETPCEPQADWYIWVSALCEKLKEWVVLKSPTASKIYRQLLKQYSLPGDMEEFGELASVFLAIYQYLKQQVIPNAPEISELALILKNAEAKRVKLNSPLEVPSAVLVSIQEERNIRKHSMRPIPILRQTQVDLPLTPQPKREQQTSHPTNPQANSFKRRASLQSGTDKHGLNNVTPVANEEEKGGNTVAPSAASRQAPSQHGPPDRIMTRSRRRLFVPNDHQS